MLRLLTASAFSSKSPDPAVLLAFPAAANDGSLLEMRSVSLSKFKSEDAAVPVEISVLLTSAEDAMSWMAEAGVQTIRCGAPTIDVDSHISDINTSRGFKFSSYSQPDTHMPILHMITSPGSRQS